MAAGLNVLRFPWAAAGAGALLVAAGGLSLLRLPAPPDPRSWLDQAAAPVRLTVGAVDAAGYPESLQEELALQDPTPLFLPTPWNSGQAQLPGDRLEPGSSFGSFPEKLVFPDDNVAIAFPPLAPTPEEPLATVEALVPQARLQELAREELDLAPLPPRLAQVQVSHAGGAGQELLAENLRELPAEQANLLARELWAPVEVLVAVSPGGLIGRPALASSSGSEAIDDWALDYLAGAAGLGTRLPPGFYRVVLGP